VTNETALQGLERVARADQNDWLCLNFASAKNPGGGFLGGAQAQEESLARSSGLYSSLLLEPEFYAFHRQNWDLLYSDRMIYSPHVPVFKNDAGDMLEPYRVAFITCAAPNAGAIATNQPNSLPRIPAVLERRAELVLQLAALRGHTRLVLGAWGCGVFRNDPQLVARVFKAWLETKFAGVFEHVIFAVFDRSKDRAVYSAFAEAF
jgi:uncharacterized protein (TIGR02452 family)